jgi:hypothetical protein
MKRGVSTYTCISYMYLVPESQELPVYVTDAHPQLVRAHSTMFSSDAFE